MPRVNTAPITLYITPRCDIPKQAKRIGETGAGFLMKGFDLKGETGIKNRGYFTEGLKACLGGVVLSKKLNNMFHENSSSKIYADAEGSKEDIFTQMTEKIVNMANGAREKIHVMLFGGLGYGSNRNLEEVEKSHNLFNNAALCIEDVIPAEEGFNIPLTTVWGKLDSSIKPDTVYLRENAVILVNDVFKSLFKDGKCELTKEGIIDFLRKHYEEVQIPKEVEIVATEKYETSRGFMHNLKTER